MLSTSLLTRSLNHTSPFSLAQDQTTRLVRAIQPAPQVQYYGESSKSQGEAVQNEGPASAHEAGVNCITVDRFEGRHLVSGGADGEISLWDLEAAVPQEAESELGVRRARQRVHHTPVGTAAKSAKTHTHGLTSLHFYPFDSLAFTSSSYDHTLKIWDSTTLVPSATFDPADLPIYAHASSPIAPHLLVACATQHPAVRLVDLRTGASTHTLAGHTGGAVLAVAWSPREEHLLASGGADGSVRLWDIRRSACCLGVLDMEDGVGIGGFDGVGRGARGRFRGLAHAGPVNGLCWVDGGRDLVSCGHDEKIRVWDVSLGRNTFATFGPTVRNRIVAGVTPVVVPRGVMMRGEEVLFYPNDKEVLMFELWEGRTVKRLKAPILAGQRVMAGEGRNPRGRVTALSWRVHDIELISAHGDGTIRSWLPRTSEEAFVEEAEMIEDEDSKETRERKRKRDVLEDIEREVNRTKVTYI